MATKQQTPLNHARQVLDIELAGLKAVRSQLDGQFTTAVNILKEALRRRNKLVVVGIGKSGNIGQKISATFNSTGATCVLLDTANALHGDIGLLEDGDVVLALSYSGESDELLNLLTAIKKFPVQILALTGAPNSALAKLSDVVLNASVPKEACPFNLAPTASTTAMLALGDALAMALLQAYLDNDPLRSPLSSFHLVVTASAIPSCKTPSALTLVSLSSPLPIFPTNPFSRISISSSSLETIRSVCS